MHKRIIGHEAQRNYLLSCIESNQLSHAYFFVGPEHVGKMTVARWFIESINPTERIFLPSDEEEKESTLIDDIRDLLEKVSRSTQDGGYRVLCISNVDKLNAQSGNALLKCLEEPPRNTVFILIASHEQGVLQTLISRCTTVRFSLVSPAGMSAALVVRGYKDPEAIIRMSAGRPGCAVRFMEDPTYRERVIKADDVMQKNANKPLWHRLVFWQDIEATSALECAEISTHLSLRESLERGERVGDQAICQRNLIDFALRIMELRRVPILQSSKSCIDRLFT